MKNSTKVLIFVGSFLFWGVVFVGAYVLTTPAAGSSNIRYTPTDAEVQQWENDLNDHVPAPCKNQNYWLSKLDTAPPTWEDYYRFKADTAHCPPG